MEMMLLVVCATLSGAEGWEAMEEFGKEKLDWLRKFAPLTNGIPSHDRIADVISRLNPNLISKLLRPEKSEASAMPYGSSGDADWAQDICSFAQTKFGQAEEAC